MSFAAVDAPIRGSWEGDKLLRKWASSGRGCWKVCCRCACSACGAQMGWVQPRTTRTTRTFSEPAPTWRRAVVEGWYVWGGAWRWEGLREDAKLGAGGRVQRLRRTGGRWLTRRRGGAEGDQRLRRTGFEEVLNRGWMLMGFAAVDAPIRGAWEGDKPEWHGIKQIIGRKKIDKNRIQ